LSRKGETSPEKKKTLLSTPMIMHGWRSYKETILPKAKVGTTLPSLGTQ
jgi:hypothetical protein